MEGGNEMGKVVVMENGDGIFTMAGVLAVLGAVGGGLKWLWGVFSGRVSKRERDLYELDARIRSQMEAEIGTLRDGHMRLSERIDGVTEFSAKQWTVIHLLVHVVRGVDASHPVLAQVELVLGKRLPVQPVPADMSAQIAQLDAVTGGGA